MDARPRLHSAAPVKNLTAFAMTKLSAVRYSEEGAMLRDLPWLESPRVRLPPAH